MVLNLDGLFYVHLRISYHRLYGGDNLGFLVRGFFLLFAVLGYRLGNILGGGICHLWGY